jgi:hypothetical protein
VTVTRRAHPPRGCCRQVYKEVLRCTSPPSPRYLTPTMPSYSNYQCTCGMLFHRIDYLAKHIALDGTHSDSGWDGHTGEPPPMPLLPHQRWKKHPASRTSVTEAATSSQDGSVSALFVFGCVAMAVIWLGYRFSFVDPDGKGKGSRGQGSGFMG